MSHYKPYPVYKDSGVEWLGRVPEHWEAFTLRRVVAAVKTGGTPSTESPSADIPDGIAWYTPGDFGNEMVLEDSEKRVSRTAISTGDVKVFPPGSILVVSIGATLGKVGFVVEEVSANQQINVVIPNARVDGYFLAYSLSVKTEAMWYLANAATIGIMNQEKTKDIWLAIPSIWEQKSIATHLDRETARIDALIEKKTRFIELLREKRQAMITHAVTKGLDLSVKMKDSGVEWLGEVPEHWDLKPLKYVGSSIIGLTYSPDDVVGEGEGTLVLRASNIQGGQLVLGDNVYVRAAIPSALLTREGDILICSRNGSRALIGKNALIGKEAVGHSFGAFTTIFRSTSNQFVYYVLSSSLFKFQAGRFLTTTINQLTTETLNSFEIPLPPPMEQIKIAEWLDKSLEKLDAVISRTECSIDLLKERRSAFITAAVTGQIDLREAV